MKSDFILQKGERSLLTNTGLSMLTLRLSSNELTEKLKQLDLWQYINMQY